MDNTITGILDKANYFVEKVIDEYQDILMNELNNNIFNLSNIKIIATPFQMEQLALHNYYDNKIEDILSKINIPDMKLESNYDIKQLYDLLIENVLSEIKTNLCKYNKTLIHLGLYNLASYMAELHGRINMIFNNKFEIPNIDKMNTKEFYILKLIELAKIYNNNLSIVSAIIGTDKVIIQHMFSILPTIKFQNSKTISMNGIKEVYKLVYILTRLISEKDLVTSKFIRDNIVEIKDNKIVLSKEMIKNIRNLNTDMLINERTVDTDYITDDILAKLDRGLQKGVGFSIYTLKRYISNINKSIKDGDLSTLVDRRVLLTSISNDTGCSLEEASNVIEYLSIEEYENNDVKKSVDRLNKRLFESPLVELNISGYKQYLLSYPLLIYSYEVLWKKLVYNLISECKTYNSEFIDKQIKNELVKNIKKIIDSKGILGYDNIKKFYVEIEGKRKEINLNREIDVLWVKDNTLYLVECKDIYYKFTGLGFKNDIYSAIKYINIIKKNEKELLGDKKKYIEKLFETEIFSIKPILVYRRPNAIMNSNIDKRGVDTYTIQEFKKLIIKEL
ncbi:MAG: hypothetical protein FH753_11175 [Firmicutes bacterium]|nr:hypothetical protein [Bacillota bacterium]